MIVADNIEPMLAVLHTRTYSPLLPVMALAIAEAVNGVANRSRRRLLAGVVVGSSICLFEPIYAFINAVLGMR